MAFPSTFRSIQDAVIAKAYLNDTSANRTRVKDWINQVYADACVETQAVQAAADGTLTANVASYTLAGTVVLEIKQITTKGVSETAYGPPLQRVDLATILAWRQGTLVPTVTPNGTVAAYALNGLNGLELYPTPQNADTLEIWHTALPTALSADSDVPVLQDPWGGKVLEYGAEAEALAFRKMPTDEARSMYEYWLAKLRRHLHRRGGFVTQFMPGGSNRASLIPRDRSVDIGV
jgi:hypothetical protein